VLTVEADADSIERRLTVGQLRCSGCAGVRADLGMASHGWRVALDGPVRLRPRQSRSAGRGATHMCCCRWLCARAQADGAVVIATTSRTSAGVRGGSRRR
jgi:hypothetical protein